MPKPIVRPGSEEEWEALLHQLLQQPKAQPRPFFYARVQARLAVPTPWLPSWVRRPAYVALLGILMLTMSGDGAALPPTAAANPYTVDQPLTLPR